MAVAIVGVGMLAIIGLMASAVDSSRKVSDDTIITNFVDDMLNWARITPYGKQTVMPIGADLDNHSTSNVETRIDVNGYLPLTDVAGFTNIFWAGNKSTGHAYYRVTHKPLDHPDGTYNPTDVSRVLIIVEWPINPSTGNPVTNANKRYYISQVARR